VVVSKRKLVVALNGLELHFEDLALQVTELPYDAQLSGRILLPTLHSCNAPELSATHRRRADLSNKMSVYTFQQTLACRRWMVPTKPIVTSEPTTSYGSRWLLPGHEEMATLVGTHTRVVHPESSSRNGLKNVLPDRKAPPNAVPSLLRTCSGLHQYGKPANCNHSTLAFPKDCKNPREGKLILAHVLFGQVAHALRRHFRHHRGFWI
jgi:hypothetical protein